MAKYCVWGHTGHKDIVFQPLMDDTLEKALELVRTCSFGYDDVAMAVGLDSEPEAIKELEELCVDAAKDGVSVVAIDLDSMEVVGVAFNKIQVLKESSEKSELELFSEKCKYKSSKALVDFMIKMESSVNVFEKYKTDCIFKVMFLAMSPENQTRFMEEWLYVWSIKAAKNLKMEHPVTRSGITVNGDNSIPNEKAVPTVVSAIIASDFSDITAKNLKFETLATVKYEKFPFAEKLFNVWIKDEVRNPILVARELPIQCYMDSSKRNLKMRLFAWAVLSPFLFALVGVNFKEFW